MKNSEIKELTTKEIIERLDEEKSSLIQMKINHAISPIENPQLISKRRRLVARLMTELQVRKPQNFV